MKKLIINNKEYNEFGSALKIPGGQEGQICNYILRCDSFGGGCSHNCTYCYARSLLDFRGLWKENPTSVTDLKKIEKTLEDVLIKDKKRKFYHEIKNKIPFRIGGMTDCFQDIEADTENTYNLIKLLNKYDYPYLILTKSTRISEDKYLEILNPDLTYIQVTVTTLNDKYSKLIEPGAPTTNERLETIKKLSDKGLYVAARFSPIFPMYPDGYFTKNQDGELFDFFSWELVHKACQNGAKTIISEFLRMSPFAKKWIGQALGNDFDWAFNEHSFYKGGSKHFSTDEKKYYFTNIKNIADSYGVETSICDDGDFEAFKEFWANPNDCCNGVGKVKGFKKTIKEIY